MKALLLYKPPSPKSLASASIPSSPNRKKRQMKGGNQLQLFNRESRNYTPITGIDHRE
jgi:hypothetical protein